MKSNAQLGERRVCCLCLIYFLLQINHKYPERRLLVAESCGALAPYLPVRIVIIFLKTLSFLIIEKTFIKYLTHFNPDCGHAFLIKEKDESKRKGSHWYNRALQFYKSINILNYISSSQHVVWEYWGFLDIFQTGLWGENYFHNNIKTFFIFFSVLPFILLVQKL